MLKRDPSPSDELLPDLRSRWESIELGSPGEPTVIQTKVSSRQMDERGSAILRELQRPMDPSDREEAMRRFTVTSL